MPLGILNGSAYFAVPMPLVNFPQLLQDHLEENPDTPQIEALGRELVRTDFPADTTVEFVKAVCGWGDYPGIAGRVLRNDAVATISRRLRDAVSSLSIDDIAGALT
jgi:hypothetical protein